MRFGKKLLGNRKIARGEAECYLNCCKRKFQNCTQVHGITYLLHHDLSSLREIVLVIKWMRVQFGNYTGKTTQGEAECYVCT